MTRGHSSVSRINASSVFLSHSSKDRNTARCIRDLLQRHGISVWYSEHKLTGAVDWHQEIGRALARCTWFVLLLSRNAAKSEWVNREYVYALDNRRYRDRIVPVVIGEFDKKMIWAITGVQRIDLRKRRAKEIQSLLSVWGKSYDGEGFLTATRAKIRTRRTRG
jgi:hypothetical protein